MRPALGLWWAWLAVLCQALPAMAAPPAKAARGFDFAVVAQPTRPGGQQLQQALHASRNDALAFLVLMGIKTAAEPCSDELYEQRLDMLQQQRRLVLLVPAAADWATCQRDDGSSNALERLSQLREQFFSVNTASTSTPPRLMHQSSVMQFRAFAENLRWEVDGVMFATLNLPANNNHYVAAAGRNSEFEDRAVANRDWLQRVSAAARKRRARALVLFFDGDPRLWRGHPVRGEFDGYAAIRRQLREIAARFPGKLLLVHHSRVAVDGRDQRAGPQLSWRGNLGELIPGSGWTRVHYQPRAATFTAARGD